MKRTTTTQQLNSAITNNLLQVVKAECHYKSTNQIDEISKETFLDNLAFLNESGVFADFVDWHYEKNLSEKVGYVIDSGCKNPYTNTIVTVYLRMNDSTNEEKLERMLLFEEE